MSASTFTHLTAGPPGATAATDAIRTHRVGDAVRAVRIFATSAFDVVVFGEYHEEAGLVRLRRRHHF